MSWQLIERGQFNTQPKIEPGTVTVDKAGKITFLKDDLELVGITEWAAVLSDPETMRIAFRKPKEHEQGRAMKVYAGRTPTGKDNGRRSVTCARAIKSLYLTTAQVSGRHELKVKDDTLLILAFCDLEIGKVED